MHKGVEQPQVIVYVLFVVVLTLAGIYVAFTQLGGANIAFEFQDYASRLNAAATKLIFTPECFAVETSYTKGGIYYQVSGGIIDWTKFNGTTTISQSCLSGEQQVWVSLTEVNDKYSDTIWSCTDIGCFGSGGCNIFPTQYACEVAKCTWGTIPCAEPTKEQISDPKQWLQTSRSYLVLIKNGTTTDQGVLTVRLKT
jgi:hypothetical protein